jgi:hypothetical protein
MSIRTRSTDVVCKKAMASSARTKRFRIENLPVSIIKNSKASATASLSSTIITLLRNCLDLTAVNFPF